MQRIVDYIPVAVDFELLLTFADELQAHLITKLGLNAEDASARCAEFLAESRILN